MTFHILTLFPEMFVGPLTESILKRAREKGLIEVKLYNLRDFAQDKHKTVDDTPYGGGAGMVLKVDVMDRALSEIKNQKSKIKIKECKTILMTPQGKTFDQAKARELSTLTDIILVCGHYEGFDERIREHLVDEEISIGDFVLSGGEIAAMAIVDATARLIPGVLGHDESSEEESFSIMDDNGSPLIEYPIYTRPEEYMGWRVPDILKSGNHAEIKKWRMQMATERTNKKRKDLRTNKYWLVWESSCLQREDVQAAVLSRGRRSNLA